MSDPTVDRVGQEVRIGWKDEGVSLVFDQITQRVDGTHAEITPTMNGVKYPTPLRLTPSRINLLSTRAREDWGKRARKITQQTEIPWDCILENSISYVLAVFRRGEPAVLLNEATISQPSYIVKPLIYERLPATVFALAAKGKSLFGLFVCLLAECGKSACGLTVSKSHQTLFLDWELDHSVQGFRKQQII